MTDSEEEREQRYAELVAEASNPTTSPERLRELYTGASDEVPWSRLLSDAVMANPNLPPDLLFDPPESRHGFGVSLLQYSTDAFLTNPVVPLLLLEMPDLPNRLLPDDLLLLLTRAALPPAFVASLRNHTSTAVRDAAAYHIHTTGEMDPKAERWQRQARHHLFMHAINEWDRAAIWGYMDIGTLPSWVSAAITAKWPLPWWKLDPLPDIPQARARAVASNPETPVNTLIALARSSEDGVTSAVYNNPATPEATRDAIRNPSRAHYGANVIIESNAPLSNFAEIVSLPFADLRPDMLAYLVEQRNPLDFPHWEVRLGLALNPTLPPSHRKILATKEGHAIVRAAARARE